MTDTLTESVSPPARPSGSSLPAKLRAWAPAVLAGLAVLILWEALTRFASVSPVLLPSPSVILEAAVENFSVLSTGVLATGKNAVLGLILGASSAFIVGMATVRWRWLRDALLPLGVAFAAMPIVATAPIFNLWFGVLSPWSKIAVVSLVSFFPVLINTITGLQSASPRHIELMKSYAASPWAILMKLRLPTALPFIFGALRISAPLAVIAAVVADFFGGYRDTAGFNIKNLLATANFGGAWATVALLCGLGLLLFGIVAMLERLALHSQPDSHT